MGMTVLKQLLAGLLTVLAGVTFLCRPAMPAPRIALPSETISWEASTVQESGREVIAGGVRTYSPDTDIIAHERPELNRNGVWWSRTLNLDDTFSVSAAVHREPLLDGFGLMVNMSGGLLGFSWEWFDRYEGNIFRKRQGGGQVSVTLNRGPGYEELQAVEFLDDIVLRYLDDINKPPGTHTHEVIIRKGSILMVAPRSEATAQNEQKSAVPGAGRSTNGPYIVGGGVSAPVVIDRPVPSYTEEARNAEIEGFLVMQCVVSAEGKARDCKILNGLGYGLDESAADTVTARWRFTPGSFQGKPVDVKIVIEVGFRLHRKDPQ
ncbi:MAG TPA: energy transducer TonB [Acidobacteriota bacterium]|nr:energy transducer TonB [Acidobacteriota bacterium]